MNWKPIDTAPRDGTVILLFWPSGKRNPIIDCWDGSTPFPEHEPEFLPYVEEGSFHSRHGDQPKFHATGWEGGLPFGEPSHWMPMPEPPKP